MGDPVLSYSFFAVYGLMCAVLAGNAARVLAPTVVSYLMMVTVTLIRYFSSGLASPDAMYYDRMAVGIANGESSDMISAGKEGLSILLAGIYGTLGHDPVYGLWVNAIACSFTVATLAAVAGRLDISATKTAWIATLYPAFFVWGSLLLREAIVWFLLALIAFAMAGIVRRRGRIVVNMLVLAGAFVLLLAFRGSVAILVMVAAVAAISVSRRAGVGIYVLIGLFLVVLYLSPLADQVSGIFDRYSIDQIATSREALQRTADSGFTASGGIVGMVQVAPRVLFGPFLWELGTVGLPGVVDGILWTITLLLAVRGVWLSGTIREVSVLIFPAAALVAVLVAGSGNYGTMVRLRTQAAVLLLPLAAAGMSRVRDKVVPRPVLKTMELRESGGRQ